MQTETPVDSIIFDMDGTLWDAVDSYAVIWNTTLDEAGIAHKTVSREDLLGLMGSYLDDILARIVPHPADRKALLAKLMDNETNMMPRLGGTLYPGAREVVEMLSKHYRLFMVSNCGVHGLDNFVEYTGLKPYFTNLLSHGATGASKAENIRTLIDRYDLKRPVYVGDTQSDADNAARAGIPTVWAAYGFGHIDRPAATIHSITELPEAVASIGRAS